MFVVASLLLMSVSIVAADSGTKAHTNRILNTTNPVNIKKVVPVPFFCLPTSPKATIKIGNDIDNAMFIPLCDMACKVIGSVEEVKPRVPGTVEDLHQNLSCVWLK